MARRRRLLGGLWLPLAVAAGLAAPCLGDETEVASAGLPRHVLEEEALSAPDAVLRDIGPRVEQARAAGDQREVALLLLARANACRVMADWHCQRAAGAAGQEAGRLAGDPILQARAMIGESRAWIAMQDFTRGEELLGKAELLLKSTPSPELTADIQLAYSSLSHSLGKHGLSAEYAARGLAGLAANQAVPTQARLLRNLARAQANLGKTAEAQASLARARQLAERIGDPKLSAEILLEAARVARSVGNLTVQQISGKRVIALGLRLRNSQITGMGHEVLGLAALSGKDLETAARELDIAYQSFRDLGMKRDELRVLRALLRLSIDRGQPRTAVDELTLRFLEIDGEIESSDRAKAADDFDARLKYAERELDVLRLKDEAVLAGERERALAQSNRHSRWLSAFAAAILLVLGALLLLQRRSTRRLKSALALLRESEARAHDLLNLSSGFVFLHDLKGRLLLVNPATAAALGRPALLLVGRELQEFQPRSRRDLFNAYLQRLRDNGTDEGVFLVRSGEGDHRHWRYSSRLSVPADGRAYVVGNAVDVTDQVQHTLALHEQSVRDALTGSYNRRQLDTFERKHEADRRWGIIAVDLDHFKQINDVEGHDRGDQVLIQFVQFLTQRVREVDAVVRLGGDEFVLLLTDVDAAALQATVGRLRADAASAPCRFSMGPALREAGENLAATLARADAAMYSARSVERGHALAPGSEA